jgi:hypothetical protein
MVFAKDIGPAMGKKTDSGAPRASNRPLGMCRCDGASLANWHRDGYREDGDLTQAVQAIQHPTDTLDQEKQEIDNFVAAFATAGQIIQTITGIVTAVARIAV